MPWSKPLAYDLQLKDGLILRTLHDARVVIASSVFAGVTHSPSLELAIDLLLIAAETGGADEVATATDQVAVALRVHGMIA